jgi:hypothetical protein
MSTLLGVITALIALLAWVARKHVPELDAVILAPAAICAALGVLIAWFGYSAARDQRRRAIWAGVAFSTVGLFLLVTTASLLWAHAWGFRGDPTFRAVFMLHGAIGLTVLGATLRRARGSLGAFGLGAVGAMAALVLAFELSRSAFERRYADLQHRRLSSRSAESRAIAKVFDLTACALRQYAQGGERDFAAELALVPGGIDCTGPPAGPNELAGYVLTWTARRDVATGRVRGFQLVAEPTGKVADVAAVVSDGRGLVFVIRTRGVLSERSDTGAYVSRQVGSGFPMRGLDVLAGHRTMIKEIMSERGGLGLPGSLEEVARDSTSRWARYIRTVGRDSTYQVDYAPGLSSGWEQHYTLSVTCIAYGVRCLRSYYVGPDGRTHGTGLPRAATEADPLVEPAEASDGVVNGMVGWRGR